MGLKKTTDADGTRNTSLISFQHLSWWKQNKPHYSYKPQRRRRKYLFFKIGWTDPLNPLLRADLCSAPHFIYLYLNATSWPGARRRTTASPSPHINRRAAVNMSPAASSISWEVKLSPALHLWSLLASTIPMFTRHKWFNISGPPWLHYSCWGRPPVHRERRSAPDGLVTAGSGWSHLWNRNTPSSRLQNTRWKTETGIHWLLLFVFTLSETVE